MANATKSSTRFINRSSESNALLSARMANDSSIITQKYQLTSTNFTNFTRSQKEINEQQLYK
jgi:hypothetical protein